MFSFACLLLQLFQRATKLVGTRSALRSASDTVQFTYDVVHVLTLHQLADPLQVAVASTQEGYLLDDVVLVHGHINHLRASAVRLVLYMSCCHNLPFFADKGTNKREENQKNFGFSRAKVPSTAGFQPSVFILSEANLIFNV